MPYVMLPVPAEHEEEFGHWLLSLTLQAKLSSWPDGAVAEIVAWCEEPTREIVSRVARYGELWAPVEELAAAIDIDGDAVVDRVTAVNEHCQTRGVPPLVMVRDAGAGADHGASRALMMGGEVRTEVLRTLDPAG